MSRVSSILLNYIKNYILFCNINDIIVNIYRNIQKVVRGEVKHVENNVIRIFF